MSIFCDDQSREPECNHFLEGAAEMRDHRNLRAFELADELALDPRVSWIISFQLRIVCDT